jgi:glucose-1-phosphate cytidylyltransferase
MKAIILCGGKGSRLAEETKMIPKPMVKIGGVPIIVHIIKHFNFYGFNEIILATGYKSQIIKNYFKKNYKFSNISTIYTGKDSLTGGRLLRLKKFISKDENFFLTYGDGLTNLNLKKLLKFHLKHKKIGTVTAVHPPVRFGELELKNNLVKLFAEKKQTKSSWISGGYFIFKKNI